MSPATNFQKKPKWLIADLRSDHAGELGAVMIYRGILAISSRSDVRAFAKAHLATELQHLELMEALLPESQRSKAQLPWRIAGWLIGAIPALVGRAWVYATVEAVETFVEEHYTQQIQKMTLQIPTCSLRESLERCCADEVSHQRDAASRWNGKPSLGLSVWLKLVSGGSRAAVRVARAF